MSAARPEPLHVGDRVRFEDRLHTVVGLSGTLVRLSNEDGAVCAVQLPFLLSSKGFEVVAGRHTAPLSSLEALSGLPNNVVERALWWERQVVEVITGLPLDAPAGTAPRPEYDPVRSSVAEREQAKAAELATIGESECTARTIRRKRLRYQANGVAGLVDRRADRRTDVAGRADPRVVEAMRQAISEATEASSRTATFFRFRTEQILAEKYGRGVVEMPARATFYRLFDKLSRGRHTTGSARTRRSLANRPDGVFGQVVAARPGELMEIDSTPLDVLVLLDDGVPGRVELTGMVDLATRSVTAAVLAPTTKSVDASLLLARTVTPEPMRPGWPDALRLSRSVLAHRHLVEIDERLSQAVARPVIVPDTIVCDRGKVFVSANFRSACRSLGISLQPAHPRTPTGKPHIERTIESVGTLFCQFVSGYLGSSVERRGSRVEAEPLWSMVELQELLDEWIVAGWQNRPHDGLRDPAAPGKAFTPNEKYAALVASAGYVSVALSGDDYVELLPAVWRVINAYGVKLGHRVYDCDALNPFRRQDSGVAAKRQLWEVHHDPYDVTRIWVRNHWDGGWITVPWRHLSSVPMPFGQLAWDHASAKLRAEGSNTTEADIAEAVTTMLERAGQGPERTPSAKRERRVAARTRATSPSLPASATTGQPAEDRSTSTTSTDDSDDELMAEVIPLGVFDAREEAKNWW